METREGPADRRVVNVSTDGLTQLGVRPKLRSYLIDGWGLRHFISTQARLQSFSAARGNFLGKLWLLLDPLLLIGFYFIIFGMILKTDRGVDNFVAFLAIGIIFFRPLQASLGRGNSILRQNRALFKSFNFPKASVFVSFVLRSTYESVPDIIILLVFILVVPPGENASFHWLLILVALAFRQGMILGLTMTTGFLTNRVPDLSHVWPVLSRFWFYTSGILFSIERYVSDPFLKSVLESNPAAVLINFARQVLLDNAIPPFSMWMQLLGWSFFLPLVGLLLIWNGEVKLNRD